MTKRIPFRKMHGAGNDFILVDNRDGIFPCADIEWMRKVSRRRTGIGCDGFIVLETSSCAHFKMLFFNPDGSAADLCGNGARCAARFANDVNLAPAGMCIETPAGVLTALVRDELVRVEMPAPYDWRSGELEWEAGAISYHFVNTGVPHAVIVHEDLTTLDVARLGAHVRQHSAFAPEGTNVDFIRVSGKDTIDVRTYERGVEAETLACGTGIVASALVAAKQDLVQLPATVNSASGAILKVEGRLTEAGAERVRMLGPAVYCYDGVVSYSG